MTGSTFLSLVNKVLRHFNEVELTSSNFSSATGFQAVAKDYVNDTIREIQQTEYEWPFNWYQAEQILTGSVKEYDLYPTGTNLTIVDSFGTAIGTDIVPESVDWESFRLKRDDSLTTEVSQKKLLVIDYDEYLTRYESSDINADTTTAAIRPPVRVYSPQSSTSFGVSPIPDGNGYTIQYEFWGYASNLSLYSDTTTIPTKFDHVIFKGSVSKGYDFRGDMARRDRYQKGFEAGVNKMREILISRNKVLRDNRVSRSG